MGVYAFKPDILKLYISLERGSIEKIEDIELLRLLENGVKIRIKEVFSETIAVDTEKDLNRVRDYISIHDKIYH